MHSVMHIINFHYRLRLEDRNIEYCFTTEKALSNQEKYVVLDDCTEKHPRKKTCETVKAVTQWMKVEIIQLYERDKRNLILQSGWLDDRVINATQALLKSRTHTPGLQCTNLDSNLSFEVVKESFVQILHNGTTHWVTESTINTQPLHINIYDSKYSTITESLRDQICALMHSCQQLLFITSIQISNKMGMTVDCMPLHMPPAYVMVMTLHLYITTARR